MKYRLVTPGPAMVPPEALAELAKPVFHHRTPENKAMIKECIELLKETFVTKNDVLLFTSSGTGAMEASIANVVKPGQKVIIATAGKWGERWLELGKTFKCEVIKIEEPYGKAIDPQKIADALAKNTDTVAVYATLSETSTAVGHDIEGIGKVVAKTNALFVVDGISGVGAMECKTDEWGIDLLVVGSQKALMLPPGLAYLAISEKAKKVIAAYDGPPTYYYNIKTYLKSAADFDTPYTPAHTLIAAQVQSLRILKKIGIEKVWKQTSLMSTAMLSAVKALGLESLAERPSTALTAIVAPAGVDALAWEKLLEKKYQVKVAPGQGSLKGKIIRIAHMGYVDPLDVVGIAAALEWSLAELGYKVEAGKAVAAATKAFQDGNLAATL